MYRNKNKLTKKESDNKTIPLYSICCTDKLVIIFVDSICKSVFRLFILATISTCIWSRPSKFELRAFMNDCFIANKSVTLFNLQIKNIKWKEELPSYSWIDHVGRMWNWCHPMRCVWRRGWKTLKELESRNWPRGVLFSLFCHPMVSYGCSLFLFVPSESGWEWEYL